MKLLTTVQQESMREFLVFISEILDDEDLSRSAEEWAELLRAKRVRRKKVEETA